MLHLQVGIGLMQTHGQNCQDFCALPFLAKEKRSIGWHPSCAIASGEARVLLRTESGEVLQVATLKPGTVFGEIGLSGEVRAVGRAEARLREVMQPERMVGKAFCNEAEVALDDSPGPSPRNSGVDAGARADAVGATTANFRIGAILQLLPGGYSCNWGETMRGVSGSGRLLCFHHCCSETRKRRQQA